MRSDGLQVKIFFDSSHRRLEETLNEWLAVNPGITVDTVTQSSNNNGHCIAVWYHRQ